MCVTFEEAYIHSTRVYVHATDLGQGPVHVCAYQNEAETLAGPNCMILNFPGTNLRLVRGPEYTTDLMSDVTCNLPMLRATQGSRGGGMYDFAKTITVETYGDYTVILSQGSGDILSVLGQVPEDRRPLITPRLEKIVEFYMSQSPRDCFVLGCFNGKVKPKHPIVVSYQPRNPSVLTAPGLDGHDGRPPVPGAPIRRDFQVAFGIDGVRLPVQVQHSNPLVATKPWAPNSVTGFRDNRIGGPNSDYVLSLEAVQSGAVGRELAEQLQ